MIYKVHITNKGTEEENNKLIKYLDTQFDDMKHYTTFTLIAECKSELEAQQRLAELREKKDDTIVSIECMKMPSKVEPVKEYIKIEVPPKVKAKPKQKIKQKIALTVK